MKLLTGSFSFAGRGATLSNFANQYSRASSPAVDSDWNSYSNMSQDAAHCSLEKEVSRFGTALDMTLYIDGDPAKEKAETAAERQKRERKHWNEQ